MAASRPRYPVTAKELTFQPAAIIACWRSAKYRRVSGDTTN
jgi:hypothetical protein